jgi:DNA replication and repair protein RecF
MTLKIINFQGFRNLLDARLEFAEDFNFIIGENGAGKTNLLEAIFYVGVASSFRAREERSLIAFDSQYLKIEAEASGKKAFIYLDQDKKRLMFQGNEVTRLSDFVGWLDVTMLSIDDIWLIRGGPARRRYFLDWTIAKCQPVYLSNLQEYRKILRQRNRLLQSSQDNGNSELWEILDGQLVNYGNKIYEERKAVMPELNRYFAELGKEFGLKNLHGDYQSTCPDMIFDSGLLKRQFTKELNLGQTVIGPHRDDLQFFLNGRPLREYGSEGEERASAIALRLAEAEMLLTKKRGHPILLLDEIGAELDSRKKAVLLQLLKGQIFYASVQMPELTAGKAASHRLFRMRGGRIEVS